MFVVQVMKQTLLNGVSFMLSRDFIECEDGKKRKWSSLTLMVRRHTVSLYVWLGALLLQKCWKKIITQFQ